MVALLLVYLHMLVIFAAAFNGTPLAFLIMAIGTILAALTAKEANRLVPIF